MQCVQCNAVVRCNGSITSRKTVWHVGSHLAPEDKVRRACEQDVIYRVNSTQPGDDM